jgi:hypothetical protein
MSLFELFPRQRRELPDIAHALDYHDQMHMVRDFNRLSGDSPTTICGQLDMFVKPEVASGGRASDGFLGRALSTVPVNHGLHSTEGC